jgi:hypothetical protein
MNKTIEKWSFKGGLRAEMTHTIGDSDLSNEPYKDSYIDFFPTLFISRQLNRKSSISFRYSDRIERPPYQYLDPFKWYISKYDYAMGNPFLKPSYVKNFELSYMLNNSFSTKLYYTDQNNEIGQYVILDSLNILNQIQKADNFLDVNTYGINVYKFVKWFQWMETVLQADVNYSDYLSNIKEFSDISGYRSILRMNNAISLPRNFQLVLSLEESLPGLYNYRTTGNSFQLDVGLNYTNPKSGLGVRFFVGDVFKTANPEYYYVSAGVKQIYQNYYDTRLFKVVLTWRPGNWYNKSPYISSPTNNEEKQRL